MSAKILLGLPAYGGMVSTVYLQSLLSLLDLTRAQGIELRPKILSQESLVTRARNTIVAEFLGREEFTHLLFIDADIGFPAQLVLRMLALDKPLTAAAYPMKDLDWNSVQRSALRGAAAAALPQAALNFVLNLVDEDRQADGSVPVSDGFVRVSKAGTGFMLIRRDVFPPLIQRFPELRYENDIAGYNNPQTKGNFWAFFDTLLHPQTRRYLSEDYAFCHRWTQGCGGEIWMNIDTPLSHHGQYAFSGSLLDSISVADDRGMQFTPRRE
ncbi:MAG: hypothetical protein P4L83_24085 [Nevskia sp.]|nr:hypothetical protein [Nevskia sp.]